MKMLSVAAAALACLSLPALAQGSDAEREACTPDAMRLCGNAIPDAGKVESCLRSAGLQLSPACHAVFFPPTAASADHPGRKAP
jgi:hypothetical protein